jgi:hypothetical protein
MRTINFTQTLHYSRTIPEVPKQFERLKVRQGKVEFVDRGYGGIRQYKGSTIHISVSDKNIIKAKRKCTAVEQQ